MGDGVISVEKILKPCAIIPKHLYVERDADRQLSRIISDMGRPGYVLVSRQMGKTNLLLNAKRRASQGDFFAYFDASNVIPSLRSFFRAIVDTCIDSCNLDSASRKKVYSVRDGSYEYLEHREHEMELREVLRCIPGKLVVFLDEIDALTRVGYSDQVFSFIRSVYFSGRTNFPEFDRLTYVLSGVAEPSEIIKDRSISPFNIGDKIYLDDFSYDEFCQFLSQAGLWWPPEIPERVYYWANGNPRISWDLCSALEDLSSVLSVEVVDELVERLYLTDFDLPPVDHIRTLVQADREIRGAVVSINYGRYEAIPDSVKSRLHLAGVASSQANGEVHIKNRVIEAALSDRWLSDLEKYDLVGIDYADQLFMESKFSDAIVEYKKLEGAGAGDGAGELDVELIAFKMARCHYALGAYETALDTLKAHPYPRSKSHDMYIHSMSLLASIQLVLGDFPSCISSFERLLKEYGEGEDDQPTIFHQAQINLATAYLSIDGDNFARVNELCASVIRVVSIKGNVSVAVAESNQRLLCSANFNLYRSAYGAGEYEAARGYLRESTKFAGRSDKATLMLEDARTFESGSRLEHALRECVHYCSQNRVPVTDPKLIERPLSFHMGVAASLCHELVRSFDFPNEAFDDFLSYCCDENFEHEVSAQSVLCAAATVALGANEAAAKYLYEQARSIGRARGLSDDTHGFVCLMSTVLDYSDGVEGFIDDFPIGEVGPAYEYLKYFVSHNVVRRCLSVGRIDKASEILDQLGARLEDGARGGDFDYLVGVRLSLSLESVRGRSPGFESRVSALLESIISSEISARSYYKKDAKDGIVSSLLREFPTILRPRPVQRAGGKIGRNDVIRIKMIDGVVVEGKYKRLEALIESGQAVLIREPVDE